MIGAVTAWLHRDVVEAGKPPLLLCLGAFVLTILTMEHEGRLSVQLVGLTVAVLGLIVIGAAPFGANQVGTVELGVRLVATFVAVADGLLVLVCDAKGKYRLALFAPIRRGRGDATAPVDESR